MNSARDNIEDTEKKRIREHLLERVRLAPSTPGCYLWLGENEEPGSDRKVLYVGKAINLRSRTRQYLNTDDYKTLFLMARVRDIDWISTNNEVEALLLENNLIKKHNPPYNVRLRDDKSYPYLCLTMGEPFPRLIVTRKKKNPKHLYFGPYIDAGAARNTLALIHRIFPIRKRALKLPLKKPARPCLNYHIGRCLSPCSGKVGIEEYGELIQKIKSFLEGKNDELVRLLQKEMGEFSENQEYEKAAARRDMLRDIETLYADQSVHAEEENQNYDVIGMYVVSRRELAESLDMETISYQRQFREQSAYLAQFVLLRVRNGNLINKGAYTMTDIPAEKDDENLRNEFMDGFFREYYLQLPDPPPRIFAGSPFFNGEIWSQAIKKSAGVSAEIISPENGSLKHTAPEGQGANRGLMKMAVNNARLTLREKVLSEQIRNQRFGLRQIQKFLDLERLPEIIECYDISNIQGKQAVGCGVYLKNGIPYKAGYRRYKIRTKETPDDPAMMHEVLDRRLARLKSDKREIAAPDLIVIDGGATQLNAALEARRKNGAKIPMIGLAKKLEEIYTEEGEILQMDKNSPGMLILRLARDEAHRFSVSYHRTLRNKKSLTSSFAAIPGMGPQKTAKVLEMIQNGKLSGSDRKKLRETAISIKGVTPEMADRIVETIQTIESIRSASPEKETTEKSNEAD